MKKLIATLVTVLVSFVALPETVEAGHYHIGHSYTYRSGSTSCGCAIYTKRVVVGYDCYRRPIYRYYSQPVSHRCHHSRSHYRPQHSHHGNRYYSHYPHRSRSYPSRSHRSHRSVIISRRGSSRTCR
ncbi:MAG: hypothetical protein ACPG32_07225 [Akkermansiaceae bacterium]